MSLFKKRSVCFLISEPKVPEMKSPRLCLIAANNKGLLCIWERKIFVALIIGVSYQKPKPRFDRRDYNCCTVWRMQCACTGGFSGRQALRKQEQAYYPAMGLVHVVNETKSMYAQECICV